MGREVETKQQCRDLVDAIEDNDEDAADNLADCVAEAHCLAHAKLWWVDCFSMAPPMLPY